MQENRSILDSVREDAADLEKKLGTRDRGRLNDYLDNLREIEQRIQRAEKQTTTSVNLPDAPIGIPESFHEHATLMYDLMAVAYESNVTRVISYMKSRDASQRVYPNIGVMEPHHAMSHHGNNAEKLAGLVKLNTYHTTLFARFLERLKNTPDGDGSLLDHSLILYGSGMSESDTHSRLNLPTLLVGGAAGQMKGNRHIQAAKETPVANLMISLANKFDCGLEKFGTLSTGHSIDMKKAWLLSLLLTATVSAATSASLIEAVRSGDNQAVRTFLNQRANVNATEPDGMTALHWAARGNNLDTVQLLLRAGANAKAANRYGVTPLSLAATNGNAAMVEALIKAGADPNAALPEGETVLMTAARTGNPETVKALIAHGANVNATENWQNQTALMFAAAENNAAAVKVLVEAGADMNLHSKVWEFPEYKYETNGMAVFQLPRGGWTAAMFAARQNAIAAAAMLGDLKADLDARDGDGTTALQLAILNVHYDLAAVLLRKGANPDVQDNSGMTALYAAVDMRSPAGMMTRPNPKLEAEFDASEMIRILLANKANPNLKLKKPIIGRHNNLVGDTSLGEGATPLLRAAKTNDLVVMRMLLEGGADPTLTLKDRTTPAMITNSLDAIKLLVEHGLDVNAFNTNGQTIAHNAAGRGANADPPVHC